jgi:TatD DNase family protein
LARSLALPIVVHIRQASEEALDILSAENAGECGVVLHCFSGSRQDAFRALDLGYSLGVGGVLTFKNSRLPDLIKDIPLESILLETDCPFLAPHPYRGKRNQPALVAFVYRRLAEILNRDFQDIESIVDRNAQKFFEFE